MVEFLCIDQQLDLLELLELLSPRSWQLVAAAMPWQHFSFILYVFQNLRKMLTPNKPNPRSLHFSTFLGHGAGSKTFFRPSRRISHEEQKIWMHICRIVLLSDVFAELSAASA